MKNERDRTNPSAELALRGRLDALLSDAVEQPVVLLSAASGHGKTQAVASFLERQDAKVAWLTLTRLDNYTSHFWSSFTGSLATWDSRHARQFGQGDFPDSIPAFHQFLHQFSKLIYSESRVILAFDDFHMLEPGKVRDFIENLIAAGIENLTVILMSGMDVSISGAGDGRIARLTDRQLRFTPEETAAYYAALGLSLSPEQLEGIYQLTEGWALAVYLFGTQLRRNIAGYRDPVGDAIPDVFHLLEQEIFAAYPPATRRALTRLSLLQSFSPELACELTGISREELLELIEGNVFVRYIPQSSSYAFHTLFQRFLQRKQIALDKGEKRDFYAGAARWYASHGNRLEAILYFELCGDHESMFGQILLLNVYHMSKKLNAQCRRWLEDLPPSFVRGQPLVRVKQAILLYNALETQRAKALLHELRGDLSARPPSPANRSALGEVYTLLALISMADCTLEFVELFRLARECLPGGSRLVNGRECFLGNNNAIILPGPEEGSLQAMQEALAASIPHIEQVLGGYGYGLEHLAAAEAAYYTGDFRAASRHAFQAIAKGTERDQWDIVCNSYYLLMRIGLAEGNCRHILGYLRRLEAVAGQARTAGFFALPDIASSWFYLKIGKPDRIAPWLRDDVLAGRLFTPLSTGKERIMRAGYLLAEKRYWELLAFADESIALFRQKGQMFILLKLLILKAITLGMLEEVEAAQDVLLEAWRLSHKNRLVMPFAELGSLTRTLINRIRRLPAQRLPEEWLATVYAKASTYAKHQSFVVRQYGEQFEERGSPLDHLTEKEREVLLLMCDGLIREEIAEKLELSVNTVKGVIKRIYNKLDALNRADAVRIAMAHLPPERFQKSG